MQFSAAYRLKHASEFTKVFKNTEFKVRSDCFLVLVVQNALNFPRLGLIVAKKNVKKASKRNLVKRIIRESFRLNRHQLPAVDVVVLVTKPCGNYTKPQFWQNLNQAWQILLKNWH